jgi:hypothetical protein
MALVSFTNDRLCMGSMPRGFLAVLLSEPSFKTEFKGNRHVEGLSVRF